MVPTPGAPPSKKVSPLPRRRWLEVARVHSSGSEGDIVKPITCSAIFQSYLYQILIAEKAPETVFNSKERALVTWLRIPVGCRVVSVLGAGGRRFDTTWRAGIRGEVRALGAEVRRQPHVFVERCGQEFGFYPDWAVINQRRALPSSAIQVVVGNGLDELRRYAWHGLWASVVTGAFAVSWRVCDA